MTNPARRGRYARHADVIAAEDASLAASKETWVDPDAPTGEEEVAAKKARLAAKIAAQQAKVDAE